MRRLGSNPVSLINPVNVHHLLLATRNPHKTREFVEIMGDGFGIRDLTGVAAVPEMEETGNSFESNAILKAVEASRHFPDLIVADDSGLEVDALQGAPGIYSARYAGERATDAENIAKLLAEIAKVDRPDTPLRARFRCWLALARVGKIERTFEGVVEGVIVTTPRGEEGFGYDPIFEPKGCKQTFGEMTRSGKNQLSHRARAIRLLRQTLLELREA